MLMTPTEDAGALQKNELTTCLIPKRLKLPKLTSSEQGIAIVSLPFGYDSSWVANYG